MQRETKKLAVEEKGGIALVRRETILPPDLGSLGPDKKPAGTEINAASKDDELLVRAVVGLDDASCNGNTNQTGK